ncbi:MAG: heme-binding domain-containing protein [Ferruginibacter sp.]
MRLFKRILLILLIGFVAIQFFRPRRNIDTAVLSSDIINMVDMPERVSVILKNSCYDCHSNNTRYPWYINIQPMGWIMADHIRDGKKDLNFSEFGSYSPRKQTNKLRAIESSVKSGEMPISSYTLMHSDAKLSESDKQLIAEWVSAAKDSLAQKN